MSYLDLPRVHFAGRFTTGPSTINNLTRNYDLSKKLGPQLWNPDGSAYFQFKDCTVQNVVTDGGGSLGGAVTGDTLVGQPVVSTDDWGGGGSPAKLVDLDPQQQMVSMIYGLQLKIGDGDNSLTADFEPVWFEDYVGVSAAYQSVLVRPTWGGDLTSQALKRLQQMSPEVLSIKFVVDQPFIEPPGSRPSDSRCLGRIVGTIGPAERDAPINFVEGRLLRPLRTSPQGLNFGPAIVRDQRLTIDLLNAIPWVNLDTPPDLGALDVSFGPMKGPHVTLGSFDYSNEARNTRALVQDFDLSGLSDPEMELLASSPISIAAAGEPPVFQEDPSGLYVDSGQYVFRMEADSQADCRLWAGRFGEPAQGVTIQVQDATQRLPASPPPSVGVAGAEGSALSFAPSTVVTKADGHATFTIHGGNPANARGYIDGQVYALSFHPDPPLAHPDKQTFLSLLVHDEFDVDPTWDNIQPIFDQYARLYPYMSFVPLTDPAALRSGGWVPKLLTVFGYPIEDPRYMPVVRDLSQAKQSKIVAWLQAGAS